MNILNLFKVFPEPLIMFNKKDEYINSTENGHCIDCIMALMANNGAMNMRHIHAELYKCCIYISYRELEKVLNYLQKERVIAFVNENYLLN